MLGEVGGRHWSEVVGDDAESFLRKAATSDAPFFMYLAFNAPHSLPTMDLRLGITG